MKTFNADSARTSAEPQVMMVAAEASSSLYAQRLIEHWKSRNLKVKTFGVGSRSMEKLGFEILGRSEDLAVVGIQEVLSNFGLIRQTFHALVREAKARKPDVILLLDYPDFNLRLAKKLSLLGLPVVYYISPQIWAWRQGRVHIVKKWISKMLVLFPFEVPFYEKHQVPVRFVGHPLLDEMDSKYFDPAWRQLQRGRYGIAEDDLVLGLMPGSRHSELKQHLQLQIQVAERLHKIYPKLKIALLVAPTFDLEHIQSLLPRLDFPLMLFKDEPFDMISLTDLVLCASGTATLMVGLMEKPGLIMYRMNAMTAWFAKRLVKSTKYFGLINLVLDEEVMEELFQEKANVENLVDKLSLMIQNPQLRNNLSDKLKEAKFKLGDKGANLRVCEELEKYWSQNK